MSALLPASQVYAQPACSGDRGNDQSPNRTVAFRKDGWDGVASGTHLCSGGVHVSIQATLMKPGDLVPGGRIDRPLGPVRDFELPIYCRRDDYAFLPPNALGGLPCLAVPPQETINPRELALQLERSLPPPQLRIRMNPQLGLVAVPTWFWVEGFDGGDIGSAETVLVVHVEEHFEIVRDESGNAILEADGRPRLRLHREVRTNTFTVDVRLWPSHYTWDFGDAHAQEINCTSRTLCLGALGTAYVDPKHPSSIQHPYTWTSLGKTGSDGERDTYPIGLGINFSAAFRVAVNGESFGGWQDLPDRALAWSASHQVQEAQAILTRP